MLLGNSEEDEQGVGGQPPGKSYLELESWGGGATTFAMIFMML
jgi:hypothetical protein